LAADGKHVRVVVVNFNGGDLTLKCLRSLAATEWEHGSLEIVVVDNASTDGSVAAIERELPEVRVVRSPKNVGFAGGCNLGFTDLGDTDYVALVNNDATVTPGWLEPLVRAIDADPALGAVCPKILLDGKFREISLRAATTTRRYGRDVGVWVSGTRVDDVDTSLRTHHPQGWWGLEPPERGWPPGQWTRDQAMLRVPVGDGVTHIASLQLSALRPGTVSITSGSDTHTADVGPEPQWLSVPLGGQDLSIINNVGSVLTDDGHGADRAYFAPDDGSYDEPADVFAWCGAGVLLRRAYLDDVGLMDDRLFVYYEDFEHAWRGRDRGWRFRTVPESVIHHVHTATTGEGSPLKLYHEERNRLLVLTRHAPRGLALTQIVRQALVTASYARRDIFSRLLHLRKPSAKVVRPFARAWFAFLVRVPGALRSRRADKQRPPR
jgi:GT2 family glycosyltransferase